MADNLELVMQLRDMLTSPAEKMATSLNHIAISARAGAQSLDRMEKKLEELGKQAEKTKKSLKDLFVFDISGVVSSIAGALVGAAKTFFGYIRDAFEILAENEEIGGTYLKILGDQAKVSRYIAYNHELAAKYAVIGSQAMDKLGLRAVTAGFKGDQYKGALETAVAVENIRKGQGNPADIMKEVIDAQRDLLYGKGKVAGLARIFGLSDTDVADIRKTVQKSTGYTLEEYQKLVKAGKASGYVIVNAVQQQVAKGKDFAKVLEEGNFSISDLLGKLNDLPRDLITSLNVTSEWKDLVKELNKTWQLIMPTSKNFSETSKGVSGIFKDMLSTITKIIKSFNEWIGNPQNITWLRKEFENIRGWLEANIWHPLTDPNASVTGKILTVLEDIAFKFGEYLVDAMIKAFVTLPYRIGGKFGSFLSDKWDDMMGTKWKEKAALYEEDVKIKALKKERDQQRALKGFEPIGGGAPILQSLPQNQSLPQKPIDVKVTSLPPQKIEPYESRPATLDKSQTHEYNFNWGDLVLGGSSNWDEGDKASKAPSRQSVEAANDLKKNVERALQNVRAPKDQGR